MKKTVFTLVAMLSAFSAPLYAESRAEILRIIERTPSEYCGIDKEEARIIRSGGNTYVLYGTSGTYDPHYKEYGGQPCSGGSGTYISHLAKLEYINGELRIVDSSLLENLNINTRFINTEGMKVNNGIWTFTNNEFANNDPNCCASKVYMNQIRLSDMKVLSRKFIGRRRY
ncbi:hypothetical protein [Neisseria weaveri]|uniref:Periplasmic protein n=1 Tax=Neisseria weaveri TaxID=28091 RepID=A0A3S5CAG9_9NEIS|nr:hypothetical protein [Neisseria weaveri]VEJ51235.1 Uncharacterised protein [Neisseria weaveri]